MGGDRGGLLAHAHTKRGCRTQHTTLQSPSTPSPSPRAHTHQVSLCPLPQWLRWQSELQSAAAGKEDRCGNLSVRAIQLLLHPADRARQRAHMRHAAPLTLHQPAARAAPQSQPGPRVGCGAAARACALQSDLSLQRQPRRRVIACCSGQRCGAVRVCEAPHRALAGCIGNPMERLRCWRDKPFTTPGTPAAPARTTPAWPSPACTLHQTDQHQRRVKVAGGAVQRAGALAPDGIHVGATGGQQLHHGCRRLLARIRGGVSMQREEQAGRDAPSTDCTHLHGRGQRPRGWAYPGPPRCCHPPAPAGCRAPGRLRRWGGKKGSKVRVVNMGGGGGCRGMRPPEEATRRGHQQRQNMCWVVT